MKSLPVNFQFGLKFFSLFKYDIWFFKYPFFIRTTIVIKMEQTRKHTQNGTRTGIRIRASQQYHILITLSYLLRRFSIVRIKVCIRFCNAALNICGLLNPCKTSFSPEFIRNKTKLVSKLCHIFGLQYAKLKCIKIYVDGKYMEN